MLFKRMIGLVAAFTCSVALMCGPHDVADASEKAPSAVALNERAKGLIDSGLNLSGGSALATDFAKASRMRAESRACYLRAIVLLQQSLAANPNIPMTYTRLAFALGATSQHDQAQAVIDRGLVKFPNDESILASQQMMEVGAMNRRRQGL